MNRTFFLVSMIALSIGGGVAIGTWWAGRQIPQSASADQFVQDNSLYIDQDAIVLYTQESCAASPHIRKWLSDEGVSFEERRIVKPNAHWQAIQQMGVQMTPVLLVGDTRIEGFDPDLLKGAVNQTRNVP